ncbi:hypothetical protein EDB84DRAFT_1508706, partial [Lactarius hengduanensis]
DACLLVLFFYIITTFSSLVCGAVNWSIIRKIFGVPIHTVSDRVGSCVPHSGAKGPVPDVRSSQAYDQVQPLHAFTFASTAQIYSTHMKK